MGKTYTKEMILKEANERKVQFIRLQFADIFGRLKSIAIPYRQLPKALQGEMMFDGSSIDGFVRIEESDMYLRPDLDTWCIFPNNCPDETTTARLICDVYTSNGKPFIGDPRYVLRKTLKEAKEMGYKMYAGPEAEFFLFQTDEKGAPTLKTHDKAEYFDLGPMDLGSSARKDMVLYLEKIGFEIEASHHEGAPGQHEIDFKYAPALKAADNMQTLKYAVKKIAQEHGLHATFMPKPITNTYGSGMHINQSLFTNGDNIFADQSDKLGLSKEAYYYAGGLLKHAAAITAITNPIINSYRRLVPGYEAPVHIAWSAKNRSPLVRVPSARGKGTRLEMRNPDPACNPYLAIAVMLKAGLDGIKNKITPPPSVEENIYDLTPEERKAKQIYSLPESLKDALEALKADEVIKETLGEHVVDRFISAKQLEWDEYQLHVSDWEVDRYLADI